MSSTIMIGIALASAAAEAGTQFIASNQRKNENINIQYIETNSSHFNKLIGIIHILDNYDDTKKINNNIAIDVIERAERLTMYYLTQGYKIFHERTIKDNKNEDINFIKLKNWMRHF